MLSEVWFFVVQLLVRHRFTLWVVLRIVMFWSWSVWSPGPMVDLSPFVRRVFFCFFLLWLLQPIPLLYSVRPPIDRNECWVVWGVPLHLGIWLHFLGYLAVLYDCQMRAWLVLYLFRRSPAHSLQVMPSAETVKEHPISYYIKCTKWSIEHRLRQLIWHNNRPILYMHFSMQNLCVVTFIEDHVVSFRMIC